MRFECGHLAVSFHPGTLSFLGSLESLYLAVDVQDVLFGTDGVGLGGRDGIAQWLCFSSALGWIAYA